MKIKLFAKPSGKQVTISTPQTDHSPIEKYIRMQRLFNDMSELFLTEQDYTVSRGLERKLECLLNQMNDFRETHRLEFSTGNGYRYDPTVIISISAT